MRGVYPTLSMVKPQRAVWPQRLVRLMLVALILAGLALIVPSVYVANKLTQVDGTPFERGAGPDHRGAVERCQLYEPGRRAAAEGLAVPPRQRRTGAA